LLANNRNELTASVDDVQVFEGPRTRITEHCVISFNGTLAFVATSHGHFEKYIRRSTIEIGDVLMWADRVSRFQTSILGPKYADYVVAFTAQT